MGSGAMPLPTVAVACESKATEMGLHRRFGTAMEFIHSFTTDQPHRLSHRYLSWTHFVPIVDSFVHLKEGEELTKYLQRNSGAMVVARNK